MRLITGTVYIFNIHVYTLPVLQICSV